MRWNISDRLVLVADLREGDRAGDDTLLHGVVGNNQDTAAVIAPVRRLMPLGLTAHQPSSLLATATLVSRFVLSNGHRCLLCCLVDLF